MGRRPGLDDAGLPPTFCACALAQLSGPAIGKLRPLVVTRDDDKLGIQVRNTQD
jgi:hypothetical protein